MSVLIIAELLYYLINSWIALLSYYLPRFASIAYPDRHSVSYFWMILFSANYRKPKKIGNRRRQIATLRNLGYSYGAGGDYTTALYYQENSLKRARTFRGKKPILINYNKLGLIHKELKDYKIALSLLTSALEIMRNIGFKQWEGREITNRAS